MRHIAYRFVYRLILFHAFTHRLQGMGPRFPLGLPKIGLVQGDLSWRAHHGSDCKRDWRVRHIIPLGTCAESWCLPRVQEDVLNNLQINRGQMYKVVHPFNRDNLFYEVFFSSYDWVILYWRSHTKVRYQASPDSESQMADVHALIALFHERRGQPSSGIIYCRLRATCDTLSHYLRCKGINARPYHRGLK